MGACIYLPTWNFINAKRVFIIVYILIACTTANSIPTRKKATDNTPSRAWHHHTALPKSSMAATFFRVALVTFPTVVLKDQSKSG